MLAFSQILSAFCLLHPSLHIIQSAKPFLALCFYAFHIYLAQLFFLSDLIFLLCTMLPKCSLSPYLNKISGSSSPPQNSLSCLLSTDYVWIVGIAIDLLFSFVRLPNPRVPCVCLTHSLWAQSQHSSWSILCSQYSGDICWTDFVVLIIGAPSSWLTVSHLSPVDSRQTLLPSSHETSPTSVSSFPSLSIQFLLAPYYFPLVLLYTFSE